MKHTKKFITLAVASVMALGCVSFASCGDNTDDGDDNNKTTTGDGIVKETSLQGKLFAAYTFDNKDGAATDPFTGAAVGEDGEYDLTISDAQEWADSNTKSGVGAVSGTAMAMPMYKGLMESVEDGFSFSYWNYGDTAYSDWNVMISGEYQSITYGNLSGTCGDYPGISQGVGIGAYSSEMWEAAKAAGLTDDQLSVFNSYTGYNAIVCEAAADDGSAAGSLGTEMTGTAQYITVVVDYDNCISFYRNGALAYEYYSSNARLGAQFFCVSAYSRGEEGDEQKMTMFPGACGNVDEVIVGKSLSANEVLALYNDQMGASKAESDAIIGSADDKVKARADQFALEDAIEAYTAATKKAFKSVDTSAAIKVLGSEKNNTTFWGDMVYVTPEYSGETFDVIVEGYMTTDRAANWDSMLTVIYSAGATEEQVMRMDNYGWGNAGYTSECTYAFDNSCSFGNDIYGAYVTVEVKYDGSTVTITYNTTPIMAEGTEYSGTASGSLSDGTTYNATSTITSKSYSVTYTISTLSQNTGVYPAFTIEKSCFYFMKISGGSFAE